MNIYDSAMGEFEDKRRLFPPVDEVYSDMQGRVFMHPTMDKPPWNFVSYGQRGFLLIGDVDVANTFLFL